MISCARSLLWFAVRLFAQIVLVGAFRARVFGQRNMPLFGGLLLVSNHQSYLDPALLVIGIQRRINFMARRTLFRNKLFGMLISGLNAFPVSRGGRDIAAMREAVRRLKAGECLLVFPEGTRTLDGEIGRLQPGVSALAGRAGVPLLPVVIDGAFRAWPRGGLPRPYPIAASFGRLIGAEECRQLSRDELNARLRAEMLKLQSELRKYAIHAGGG